MRLTPTFAAAAFVIVSSTALLSGLGCSTAPTTVEKVDQSVLPANAKSALTNDAQITSVYKETYAGGVTEYKINYDIDGMHKSYRYNDATESRPHGVFQDPIH